MIKSRFIRVYVRARNYSEIAFLQQLERANHPVTLSVASDDHAVSWKAAAAVESNSADRGCNCRHRLRL